MISKKDINDSVECEFAGVSESGKSLLKIVFDLTINKTAELEKRIVRLESSIKKGRKLPA